MVVVKREYEAAKPRNWRLLSARLHSLPSRMRARVRTRSDIHLHSFMLQQFANAKYVICVAHRHATAHVVGPHDYRDAFGRGSRIRALGLSDEFGFGDAAMHQVVVADSAFTERGIGSLTLRW